MTFSDSQNSFGVEILLFLNLKGLQGGQECVLHNDVRGKQCCKGHVSMWAHTLY